MRPFHRVVIDGGYSSADLNIVLDHHAHRQMGERRDPNAGSNGDIILNADEVGKDARVTNLHPAPQDAMMTDEHLAPNADARAQNDRFTNGRILADLNRAKIPSIVFGWDNPNRRCDATAAAHD
jgi:hypothetical protein